MLAVKLLTWTNYWVADPEFSISILDTGEIKVLYLSVSLLYVVVGFQGDILICIIKS